jgi:hypothetical protein
MIVFLHFNSGSGLLQAQFVVIYFYAKCGKKCITIQFYHQVCSYILRDWCVHGKLNSRWHSVEEMMVFALT